MNTLMLEAANILLVAIEFVIFVILTNSFFPFQHSRMRCAAYITFAFAIDYFGISVFSNLLVIKIMLICIILALLSRALFHAHFISCVCLSILFVSLVNVFDEVFLFGATKLSHFSSLSELLEKPQNYYFLAYMSKIAELLFVTIIFQWGKARFHHRSSTWIDYMRVSVFPITILICAIIMLAAFIQHPEVSGYLLICVVFMLLTDIAAIVLLNQFENQQQELLTTRMLQQELKLSKENIDFLATSYASERKLSHDFYNQLYVIQGLLEQNHIQDALRYLGQLVEIKPNHTLPFSTNRSVVDILLTQKNSVAQEKQILVVFQMDDMSRLAIPDDALVVLLSNLLDNAIEACEKIGTNKKREIKVKIATEEASIVLSIANTVDRPMKITNNFIESTKAQKWKHGFGLRNIISIITQYHGSYAMEYIEGYFYFVVQFELPK